jgi:hypothetical protein
VEKEFEGLYIKYVRDKKLDDQAHRSMLMCCLSIATYRILNDELGDTKLVGRVLTACLLRLDYYAGAVVTQQCIPRSRSTTLCRVIWHDLLENTCLVPPPLLRQVRDIIRTNLGSVMLAILQPVHRFKLWILRHLLREDMYKQAVNFLPALTQDMGSLCTPSVQEEQGGDVTTLTVTKCMYHDMLTQVGLRAEVLVNTMLKGCMLHRYQKLCS